MKSKIIPITIGEERKLFYMKYEIVNVFWFTTGWGITGITLEKYKNKYISHIGCIPNTHTTNEKKDAEYIQEWGAAFPAEIAKQLMVYNV